jgi:hypothetical protein
LGECSCRSCEENSTGCCTNQDITAMRAHSGCK